MTDETKDYIKLLLKMGAVGTALSIPAALAIREWVPEEGIGPLGKTTIAAVGLTALGFAIKEWYLHQPHHSPDAARQLA